MDVRLLSAPYHLGRTGIGMAFGPARIATALERSGLPSPLHVAPDGPLGNEVAATFSIARGIATSVRHALADGALPIVLAGNCSASLGVLAGLSAGRRGVVWLDAHGDFNTAATSPTGYLDGMALAACTGREWSAISATVPGFAAVAGSSVVHVGGRDFDPGEEAALRLAGATVLRATDVRPSGRLDGALDELRGRTEAVHLHIDLDVLDESEGRANGYASPGGLTAKELLAVLGAAVRSLPVRAVAFTAYDPAFDPAGRIAAIAATVAEELRAAVADL